MKTISCTFSAGLVLALSFTGCARTTDVTPAEKPVDTVELVKNSNQFAFNLHATFADESANLFYSPFSISTALGMTYAGARSDTAEEMGKSLRFPKDQTRLQRELASLRATMQNAQGKGVEFAMTNRLWV